MADPISATLSSPEAKSDSEWNAYQKLLQDQYQTGYQQVAGRGKPAPKMSIADRLAAERQYKSGEFKRRSEAAPKAYDTAQKLDTQNSEVQNQVRSALRGRNQTLSDFSRGNRELDGNFKLDSQELQQKLQGGMASQDLGQYQNEAKRFDQMQAFYEKGSLEYELANLAREGALGQADLDRYKGIILGDLNNELKDLQMMSDIEIKKLVAAWEAKSASMGSILSGFTQMAGVGAKMANSK